MPVPTKIEDVKDMLMRGEDVNFPGVGKLKITQRKARTGRNPLTGAPVAIAARRVVTFKQSPKMKEALETAAS